MARSYRLTRNICERYGAGRLLIQPFTAQPKVQAITKAGAFGHAVNRRPQRATGPVVSQRHYSGVFQQLFSDWNRDENATSCLEPTERIIESLNTQDRSRCRGRVAVLRR